MTERVFVIHGVGNRDRQAFEKRVADLEEQSGHRWAMKAVYWGDLGADDRWVDLTIPSAGEPPRREAAGPSEIRDGGEWPIEHREKPTEMLAATLLSSVQPAMQPEVREAPTHGQTDLVAAAAIERLGAGSPGGEEIREEGEVGPGQAATLREAIAEHWASTTWLRQITEPTLLQELGAAIAAPLADSAMTVTPGGEELRDEQLREIDVGGFVKRRIDDLDRVVGATVGSAAGRLNSYLRTEQGPGVTRFFGDVLVYQRRRAEIHGRVRATIAEVDPALGRDPNHPVRVVGHSLGGVIAVDLATAEDPLWTGSLVTFGSQSPFFHVCDPRGGQLQPYADGTLVKLPPSLRAWTNLWEPMDMLAFIAARVFRMHDGSAPIDLPIRHLASSGLWTHSVYWQLPQVVSAIQEALDP
jgi:hypothetical protein